MERLPPKTLKDGSGNVVYVDDWRWQMQYSRTPWFDEELSSGDIKRIVKALDKMDADKSLKNYSRHSIDETQFVS